MPLPAAPAKPQFEECERAHHILVTTHSTCQSFIDTMQQVVAGRGGYPLPSTSEQDLLRAALVFASSGVDAVIKQLVQDALPVVLDATEGQNGAAANFSDYVRTALSRDPAKAAEVLARSLTAYVPRNSLIEWFQRELKANSLQSKDQIFQVASYFDIPTADLCSGNEIKKLTDAFRMRNSMLHEMDIDFSANDDARTVRTEAAIVDAISMLVTVAARFLDEVTKRVQASHEG